MSYRVTIEIDCHSEAEAKRTLKAVEKEHGGVGFVQVWKQWHDGELTTIDHGGEGDYYPLD